MGACLLGRPSAMRRSSGSSLQCFPVCHYSCAVFSTRGRRGREQTLGAQTVMDVRGGRLRTSLHRGRALGHLCCLGDGVEQAFAGAVVEIGVPRRRRRREPACTQTRMRTRARRARGCTRPRRCVRAHAPWSEANGGRADATCERSQHVASSCVRNRARKLGQKVLGCAVRGCYCITGAALQIAEMEAVVWTRACGVGVDQVIRAGRAGISC